MAKKELSSSLAVVQIYVPPVYKFHACNYRYTKGGRALLDLVHPSGLQLYHESDNSYTPCTKKEDTTGLNLLDDAEISENLRENEDRKYSCDKAAHCITIQCDIGLKSDKVFPPKSTISLKIDAKIVLETLTYFSNHTSIYRTEFEFNVGKNGYGYAIRADEKVHYSR